MQRIQKMVNQKKTKMTNLYIVSCIIQIHGVLPYKKDGASSETLKRTPKRYLDPVLWL